MQISISRLKLAILPVLLVSAALPAVAQANATSSSGSTVVYVGGNDLVVKASNDKLLNFTVPEGYHFSIGGKQLALADLKPGTSLAKPVVPGAEPKVISSVAVVKGKIYAVSPPDSITLALTEGIKELSVPAGTTFIVDGKPMTISEIKPSMMVEATVVTTVADGAPPAETNAAAPATPPMAGALLVAKTLAAGESDLPLAGTNLPLFAVMGFALLALGLGLLTFRKPAGQR
jgi:hypothetical protein